MNRLIDNQELDFSQSRRVCPGVIQPPEQPAPRPQADCPLWRRVRRVHRRYGGKFVR